MEVHEIRPHSSEITEHILDRLHEVVVSLARVTERLDNMVSVQQGHADHGDRLTRLESQLQTQERLFHALVAVVGIVVTGLVGLLMFVQPHLGWK